jgi:hypothetical protein
LTIKFAETYKKYTTIYTTHTTETIETFVRMSTNKYKQMKGVFLLISLYLKSLYPTVPILQVLLSSFILNSAAFEVTDNFFVVKM